MREGNIISFRVYINSKGLMMTEYKYIPTEDVDKAFTEPEDSVLVQKILKETSIKLEGLHDHLEEELAVFR
jgi:hypothetical protein